MGTGTTIIPGDGLLATPGAVDTHVHLLSPRVLEASLSSGVTTVIGQEIGPVWGVGLNSPWLLRKAFAAFDQWPVNIGFLARGSSSDPRPLVEGLAAGGACGFKVHEDLGAHPRCLDTALTVAERRSRWPAAGPIHAFHVEGCGGGHAPNVLELAGRANVITSSTNPTLPFGRDAVAEHLDMIAPSTAWTLARRCGASPGPDPGRHDGRRRTAARPGRDRITSSDAQGMGRAGETVRRTFAMAGKMKAQFGAPESDDNERVLRYMAKLTIIPAVGARGGLVEVGKLADIVLWDPAGSAPSPAGAEGWRAGLGRDRRPERGDRHRRAARARPAVRGVRRHPGRALGHVRGPGRDRLRRGPARRPPPRPGPRHPFSPARLDGQDGRLGEVRVDPATGRTTLDDDLLAVEAAESVPLSRLYFL